MRHTSWITVTLVFAGACAAERTSNDRCHLSSGSGAGIANTPPNERIVERMTGAGCQDPPDLPLCTEPDAGPDCWNPFSAPANDAGTVQDSCVCTPNARHRDASSGQD